jgi:5-methylcytosine-specific restriction protein B
MGLSLLDCADSDIDRSCEKVYDKITRSAARLVPVGEEIERTYGIPIINKRISVLYDREHTIGHAYFMPLKANPTVDALAKIFENNIIPLLQEYFYEDYEKIRLVLGDNHKGEDAQFVIAKSNDYVSLFGNVDVGLDDGFSYEINKSAFANIEAYRSI